MENNYKEWLSRAKSSLLMAKAEKTEEIYYEDLCYQAEQAAEKSLKALIIYFQLKLTKTHSFTTILIEIEKRLEIPENIQRVLELEDYAVQTRYPGNFTPVTEEEYNESVSIAEEVYKWANEIVD